MGIQGSLHVQVNLPINAMNMQNKCTFVLHIHNVNEQMHICFAYSWR